MTTNRRMAVWAGSAMLSLWFCAQAAGGVVINEFMALNNTAHQSAQGKYYDWIELYNDSDATVDLTGWYLTDSAGNLDKWDFPTAEISARGYLLVYASGNDGVIAGELHADFKLGGDNGYLALVNPDGSTIASEYSPKYPQQYADISYGIAWEDTGPVVCYLATPTPGMVNSAAKYKVGNVAFSAPRGFYTSSFQVSLTNDTVGAAIYYTTNCGNPSTNSTVYTTPINITKSTVVRAAAFKTGWSPADVGTRTYIFLRDAINQPAAPAGFPVTWTGTVDNLNVTGDYEMDPDVINAAAYSSRMTNAMLSLPVLSIVTEQGNLFNATTGIYVNAKQGRDDDTGEWMRSASAEWIYPDGSEGCQINCGLKIQGGVFRDYNIVGSLKKSLRLVFNKQFGPTMLKYPVFGDDPTAVQSFDSLTLRAGGNDSFNVPDHYMPGDEPTYLNDAFGRTLQSDMGHPASHSVFVHLYLNGLYWGMYNPSEHVNASMAASYYGGDKETWDAIGFSSPDFHVLSGSSNSWMALVNKSKVAAASTTAYEELLGRKADGSPDPNGTNLLDVVNYIDYLINRHWAKDWDWPQNNYRMLRNTIDSTGYKFVNWDCEAGIGINPTDRTTTYTGVAEPYGSLKSNAEFQLDFADRVHRHYFNNGLLSQSEAIRRYTNLAANIELAMICESARWGDQHAATLITQAGWLTRVQGLVTSFFTPRTAASLQEYRSASLYPSVDAPVFNIGGSYQHGGSIASGASLTITAANSVYYTLDGTDPRQRVTGNAVGTTYSGAITLQRNTLVKSRAKSGASWSALNEAVFTISTPSTLRITEIMYNPRDPAGAETNVADAAGDFEFIELQNTGSSAIGLAGIKLAGGVTFDFNYGNVASLAPGQFVLLVKDLAAFSARYNTNGMAIAGEFSGKWELPTASLSDDNENIKLTDGLGRTILSFDYEDNWYPCTDGEGFSLAILDSSASTNNWDTKAGWRYSAYATGSPGQTDPAIPYSVGSLVINEALAHQDIEPPGDWIELRNTTASPINIGGWYLSDSELNLMKFRVPTNTIAQPNGYVVFTESADFGTNVLGTNGFGISEHGDSIYLSAGSGGGLAQPAYRENVDFGVSENYVTLGRYVRSDGIVDFTAMSAPTTNSVNAYPKVGPVVITEIMYNPTNGRNEYIELANISGAIVNLFDPLNPTNTWKAEGLGFAFPTNTTIGTSAVLLVQNTISPSAFRASNNVPAAIQIFNYTGSLDNAGETLSLSKPESPDETGVPYIDVDVVKYNDRAPWPTQADGYGYAIERINPLLYGNDPTNWRASAVGGSPGAVTISRTAPWIYVTPGAVTVSTPENVTASNQTFEVRNIGTGTLNYSIAENSAWMTVTVTNGASSGSSDVRTHTITFSTASLTVGTHTASMTINAAGATNSPVIFNVNVIVIERDRTPPALDMVTSSNSRQIRVVFDEPVQAGSGANGAENTANYGVDNGVSLSSAVLGGDYRTVTLATASAMSEGINYKLTTRNVADRAPIPNPIVGSLTNVFQYVLNNTAPVADAGSNQTVYVRAVVTLNGSGSSDPNSKPFPLAYTWSQISGPSVTINNANNVAATFTAASIGDYVFQLVAFDGMASSTDTVSVAVLFANTIPYAESFENYINGYKLSGVNSWSASTLEAAIVATNDYTYTGALPISGTHRLTLKIAGSASNFFANTESHTNVWFDMMIEGVHRTKDAPTQDSDVQFAAFVNSNGQICVWNKRSSSNAWTALTGPHVGSNEWFRLTIEADYKRVPKGFRVYVNAIAATNNGVWFDFAYTNRNYFSKIKAQGQGHLDDLVVADSIPGLSPGSDVILKVLKMERRGAGGYRIYWQSTADKQYSVYKSTNLLTGWISPPLTSMYWGTTGGTNIIDDSNSTNTAAYYKIMAITP